MTACDIKYTENFSCNMPKGSATPSDSVVQKNTIYYIVLYNIVDAPPLKCLACAPEQLYFTAGFLGHLCKWKDRPLASV